MIICLGFPEIVIGAPGSGPFRSGAVEIYRVNASGGIEEAPGARFEEVWNDEYALLGSALAAGDFNMDGFDDIAVGAPGFQRYRGRVIVLPGGKRIQPTVVTRLDGPDPATAETVTVKHPVVLSELDVVAEVKGYAGCWTVV